MPCLQSAATEACIAATTSASYATAAALQTAAGAAHLCACIKRVSVKRGCLHSQDVGKLDLQSHVQCAAAEESAADAHSAGQAEQAGASGRDQAHHAVQRHAWAWQRVGGLRIQLPAAPRPLRPLTRRSVSWAGASSRSASTIMGGPRAGAGLGLLRHSGVSGQGSRGEGCTGGQPPCPQTESGLHAQWHRASRSRSRGQHAAARPSH